jgi:hypothetical protein
MNDPADGGTRTDAQDIDRLAVELLAPFAQGARSGPGPRKKGTT